MSEPQAVYQMYPIEIKDCSVLYINGEIVNKEFDCIRIQKNLDDSFSVEANKEGISINLCEEQTFKHIDVLFERSYFDLKKIYYINTV